MCKNNALMTIKETAERLGVTHRTLKYYEELGMVIPERSKGRYRLYSEDDLIRLQRIIQLRSLGFSLGTIQEIISRPLEQNESGTAEYSKDTLRHIATAIGEQLVTVTRRIDSGKRDLREAERVRNELMSDLDYLRRRIAGESSETLTGERLSAKGKRKRNRALKNGG